MVYGLGFRVKGVGSEFRISCSGFRDFGFKGQSAGFKVCTSILETCKSLAQQCLRLPGELKEPKP